MKNKILNLVLGLMAVLVLISCTDLNSKILDGASGDLSSGSTVDVNAVLQGAYESLRSFQDQATSFAMDEHSSDAQVGPTRGGDWDDNGIWRQLHAQTWDPNHTFVRNTWNAILTGVFKCNQVLSASPSTTQEAQARFLRAFFYYHIIDKYGQMPFREIGSDISLDPQVMQRPEATDYLISELEAVLGNLPANTDPTVANKDAAHMLLAKLYLNKGVFKATALEGPYTFDATDMTKVIENVDAMSTTLAADYWDNFIPANSETSPEIAFASKNILFGPTGNIQSRWRMSNHYNQTPSGWNGFTTLAAYYDKFDPNDERINKWMPEVTANSGYNLGFQIGQQYGPGGPGVGEALKDRSNNPLVYTKEITLLTGGATLETAGIRGVKYEPDYRDVNSPDDDYVLLRYSDALLMKAEAILRGGTGSPDALTIVNQIRTRANQPALSSVDLGTLLDVRARELWWEGWRRNDLIRFGKFLDPNELKPFTSDPKRILYSIPAGALSNPNMNQNPGY